MSFYTKILLHYYKNVEIPSCVHVHMLKSNFTVTVNFKMQIT